MQYSSNDNLDYFLSYQKGEERGFVYFFHLYYKALFFYANRLLKDAELAEDMVAGSFAKFFERRASIQSAGTVKSFLYTTVRNACLDRLRQQKSRAGHNQEFAYLQEDIEGSAEDHLIRTETFSLILAAIEDLPPASRTVFKLFYLEGKSHDEIAGELGRSKETVRKQKQYGLLFLRKKLSGLPLIFLFFVFR